MTNNIVGLVFLFVVNAFVLFCWFINDGVCFLSPLEQKLDGVNYKYSNGIQKTFFAVYLEKFLKNEILTFIVITIIPIVNMLIIIYKFTTYNARCDLCMASDNVNLVL